MVDTGILMGKGETFGEVQYWYLLTDTLHTRLMGDAHGSHRGV